MRVPPSFTGLASTEVAAIVRVGVLEHALADVVLERSGRRRRRGRHREASKEKIWARGQQPRGRRSSVSSRVGVGRLGWSGRAAGRAPFSQVLGGRKEGRGRKPEKDRTNTGGSWRPGSGIPPGVLV